LRQVVNIDEASQNFEAYCETLISILILINFLIEVLKKLKDYFVVFILYEKSNFLFSACLLLLRRQSGVAAAKLILDENQLVVSEKLRVVMEVKS
jgi:hypothetical protein